MTPMKMKSLIFFSIMISMNYVRMIDADADADFGPDALTKVFEVNVYDNLPNGNSNLITHCQSKDNDFGNHKLYLNQYQRWSFHQNIFKTTLYFCYFTWNGKHQTFDVFNKHLAGDCQTGVGGNVCSWIVKSDGFYFSPNRLTPAVPIGNLDKRYNWK
ncbi:hypothetical protein ABFS83_09G044800 [Erythranthe nasuta]